MSENTENQPLLTEAVSEPIAVPSTEPVPNATVAIPQEYVDDESGKMNTIEVCCLILCLLVLCEFNERYCWYRFPCHSFSFLSSTLYVFVSDSLGWYYSWYFSVCSCVWYDDFGYFPTHQVE